jgi:hypothetical protein
MIDTLSSEGGTSRLHKSHRPHLNTGAQFTPRIERLLPIIGEQGAIAFDHLQRWCARLSPATEFMREPGVLSAERTRKVLRPWVDEEILTCKVFFASQKAWWWLTPKGYKYAGLSLRFYEPTPPVLAHLYAVNEIRLFLAERRPDDTWRSERLLRVEQRAQAKGKKREHLPDAELVSPNNTVKAIECELTAKSEKRIEDILFALLANKRYNAIWYFLPPDVEKVVRKVLRTFPSEQQKRVALYTLKGEPYSA